VNGLGGMVTVALAVVALSEISSGPSGDASAAVAPVKIMPLGDSITDGANIPGGYRVDLEDDLLSGGIAFDFVGSLSNGPAALADRNHEGHSGWRIDQIDSQVSGWLSTYQPEVVLLLIGTNDIVQDYQLSTAPARLGALLDRIHQLRPATKLIVSSVPPLANASDNTQAAAYNANVRSHVDARAAAGRSISFVDAAAALTVSDLADGIHPTSAGYAKLADVWHPAIGTALGSPSVALTAPTSGTAFASGEPVPFAAAATDSDGIARVEFFAGAEKLGEDAAAPYEWVWLSPSAGAHSLTARAVDATGAIGTSAVVSIVVDAPLGQKAFYRAINIFGPAVTIDGRTWEPTSASNFQAGPSFYENQSVPLVPATDPARATMIRSSAWGLTATQVSLLTVPAGTYEVYLTVWEDNTSATFDVRLEGSTVLSGFRSGSAGSWSRLGPWLTTVSDGSIDVTAGPDANVSGIEVWRFASNPTSSTPTVALTAPASGATFPSGATVALAASASDPDGIARVEFYAGASKLGEDLIAPYQLAWAPTSGVHSLTARAIDTVGSVGVSVPVSVTVAAPAGPQASAHAVTTVAGSALEISLAGTDADTCELTFAISAAPAHGTLGTLGVVPCTPGSPNTDTARVIYTPTTGYSGSDSFAYRVFDGSATSPDAAVSITVTPSPTGDPAALHVADLDGRATNNGKTWTAAVTATSHDGAGRAVAGVTVSGRWNTGATGSCVTGSDGLCTATLAAIQKKTATATFTVTQLTRAGYWYHPAANSDVDGDSSGTTISISKP